MKLFDKKEKIPSSPKATSPNENESNTNTTKTAAETAKKALDQNRKRRKMEPTLTPGLVNDYREDYAVKPDATVSEDQIRRKKRKNEIKVSKASKNFDKDYTESSEYSTWVPPQGNKNSYSKRICNLFQIYGQFLKST